MVWLLRSLFFGPQLSVDKRIFRTTVVLAAWILALAMLTGYSPVAEGVTQEKSALRFKMKSIGWTGVDLLFDTRASS